jgi:hypothetical protein
VANYGHNGRNVKLLVGGTVCRQLGLLSWGSSAGHRSTGTDRHSSPRTARAEGAPKSPSTHGTCIPVTRLGLTSVAVSAHRRETRTARSKDRRRQLAPQEVEATRARGTNTGRFLWAGRGGDLDHFPPFPVLWGSTKKCGAQSLTQNWWIRNLMPLGRRCEPNWRRGRVGSCEVRSRRSPGASV